jgi:putative radical SAM enzyme (TIGR03279 family)
MVKIMAVAEHSRAHKAGVSAGDILLTINGREICDVLDYRFHLANRRVELSLTREGQPLQIVITKREYDDIGLEFETPLMDEKHSCENRCIFCFIDQLPKGLRETLYFKDDDSRLSFLHGNYVTLTNLARRDIDRIIEMHISPVNVSVHTTDPELRVKMMRNKHAGEVLSYLRLLADAGITICAQVVLCRGINDGEALDRTMNDLLAYLPALDSVSIVPAGLTRYRQKLYPLEPYTPEECRAIIAQVSAVGDRCVAEHGRRVFFCADELYIKGGLPLPEDEYYENYSQLEDGIGMVTSLSHEFSVEMQFLAEDLEHYTPPRRVTAVTGVAASESIRALCAQLEAAVDGLTIEVKPIINRFFGETITVAGLLTGKDIAEQLRGEDLGDEVLIPANTLRADGDLFLCGMTPMELSATLGVPVRVCPNDGAGFLCALLGVNNDTPYYNANTTEKDGTIE